MFLGCQLVERSTVCRDPRLSVLEQNFFSDLDLCCVKLVMTFFHSSTQ